MSIVRERRIRPGLVFDDSQLNETRTLVSWLSPNYWGKGFRYGNVKFDFDFRRLVKRKQAYWVEVIDYSVPACRILITDQDHSGKLAPYDPEAGDGPWWYDASANQDYYNADACLEFMFEDEISLDRLRDISFVGHHPDYCSIHRQDPDQCREKGLSGDEGGALFLTKAAAGALDLSGMAQHWIKDGEPLASSLANALNHMLFEVKTDCEFSGALKCEDDASIGVARAVMNAVAIGHDAEARAMADLFRSKSELLLAAAEIVADTLGLTETEKIYRKINL